MKAAAPSVTFRVGRLDAAEPSRWHLVRTFEGEDAPWLSVARVPRGYLLRVHDVADFWVRADGTEIVGSPGVDCPAELLEQLLLDQILPQMLYLRGRTCLHASAVALDDGTVLGF